MTIPLWLLRLRTYLRTPTKRDRERVRVALRIPYQRPSQFLDSTKRNTPGACP